jgi:hypothetical protein
MPNTTVSTDAAPQQSARDIVLSCVRAINREDFAAARRLVSDDLSFVGVLGERHGADAYFKDMEQMRLKYSIKQTVAEGDDVCVLYDLEMSGKTIFVCGWYHVENGYIKSLRVIFDPRPVLEPSRSKH